MGDTSKSIMYSITNLIGDLEAVLHGTTVNQITNFFGLCNRAGRQLLEDVDPQETKRLTELQSIVFNNVWDYPLPPDLKGNKVIDIRPQVQRNQNDVWLQKYNQAFDLAKILSLQDQFTIQFNSGLKTIRIDAPQFPAGIVVNQAESINGNGVWSVGGGATNLRVDNQNFVSGGGSLEVDFTAGPTSSFLENSTVQSQNLSEQINQATLFLYSYFPTATDFTSVELRWGSSSSDYYSQVATVTQQNTAFQNGWNLLAFPWLGATVTGSPDPSNITYLRVTWNTDGAAQNGVRLNDIVSRLGMILEIEYYSKFLFRTSSGTFKETVTDNSDLVNLDTESYNLFFNLVAYFATQQQQGLNATFHDGNFFLQQYQQSLQRYKAMYKSELQKPTQRYYNMPNPSYSRFLGRHIIGR